MIPKRQLRTEPEIVASMEIRACKGGETRCVQTLTRHMEQCQACGIAVDSDLIDHPCFGFHADCQSAEELEERPALSFYKSSSH